MSYAYKIHEIGGPEKLVRDVLEIGTPGPKDVLVRNKTAAVNFIDTIIRNGQLPEALTPSLPHIPGVEGAGIIEAVGEEITEFAVGDRVAWMGAIGAGGYGDYSLIPESYLAKLSENIDFETAASIPVNAMTAWHMLVNLGHVKAGQTILVHAAAGGVGTMILQLAQHLGLKAVASVSSGKVDYALSQGAIAAIDYKSEDVAKRVMEITNGLGVDLTLNPVSGDSLVTDLDALAPHGTAILFGFLSGPPTGDFATALMPHFSKSIAIRVSDIYSYFNADSASFNKDLNHLFDLLEQGILNPTIESLPISEVQAAHQKLETGAVTGKLVLKSD